MLHCWEQRTVMGVEHKRTRRLVLLEHNQMELASRSLSTTEHSRLYTHAKKLTNCAPLYVSEDARCAGRLRRVRAPVIRQRPHLLGRREPPRLARAGARARARLTLFTPPSMRRRNARAGVLAGPPNELTLSMAALSTVLDRAGLRHARQLLPRSTSSWPAAAACELVRSFERSHFFGSRGSRRR